MRQGRKTTIKLFLALKKSVFGDWGEVSAAKGAAIQACGPAFDPWYPSERVQAGCACLGASHSERKQKDP